MKIEIIVHQDDTQNSIHTHLDLPTIPQIVDQTNLPVSQPASASCIRLKDEYIIEQIFALAKSVQSKVNSIPRPYMSTQRKAGLKVDLGALVDSCQELTNLLLRYPELIHPLPLCKHSNDNL